MLELIYNENMSFINKNLLKMRKSGLKLKTKVEIKFALKLSFLY